MFGSWFDQKRDLAALRSVIADGHAQAIADNGIGPAYIALAAIVHDVLGLSPEDSLVFLTRASYVLAIACGVLLVRILVRRLTTAPPLVSLAAQFAFVGLVFAAGTWHWSDVPWSHFLAAFLAVALYAVRFVPGRVTIVSTAAVGALLALLWLTRSFELAAVVAAWGITFVVLRLLRLHGARVREARARRLRRGGVRRHHRRRLPRHREARPLLPVRREPRPPVGQREPRRDRRDTDVQRLARPGEARAALRGSLLRHAVLGVRTTRAARRCHRSSRATRATCASGACRSRCSCPRSSCFRSVSSSPARSPSWRLGSGKRLVSVCARFA